MRVMLLLVVIFIQLPTLLIMPAQAQAGDPEIELDCQNASSYPFDYTYGVGMEYHTPIECEIENPGNYVVEVEITWNWEWQAYLTDEDGDGIDSTQQIEANGNLTILLEISSPNLQNVGDYEIEILVIVEKYGIGQNAMTDCSNCEEESTTEIVVIHPYYFYTRELVETHHWRNGWEDNSWSYSGYEEKNLPGQYPDCPQGIFWSVYEFRIQSNYAGNFFVEPWIGEEHESWLIDSDETKTSLNPDIRFETGETVSFKIRFEWNMTSIIQSHTTYELEHYTISFWWNGESEMDNTQYSGIKTYHPNHQYQIFGDDFPVWRDITPTGSGGYLQEMSAAPCWAVFETEQVVDDELFFTGGNSVPALSFPSTILIVVLSAILRRKSTTSE